MGKIIISLPFLQAAFTSVAFLHAGELADELEMTNTSDISNELNSSKDVNEFKEIFEKYFGEHIKIKL